LTSTPPRPARPPQTADTGVATRPAASRFAGYAIPVVLAALIFAVPFSIAVDSARQFTGVAIDGPFQLYNALRRIQGGFRPGIDFQFFHGIGIPFLHYPLFLLFGGRLEGSELARQLISTLVYPIVFLVVFRAFTGDWRRTWWLTAAALAASIALHLTALTNPLNGMLGLRSTMPMLVPVAFYLSRTPVQRALLTGVCLGLALFLSTEQGIAAVLAFCVVSAVGGFRRYDRGGRIADAIATVAIGVATFLLLVLLVAGRGTFGVLNYNFRAVPMDQYWYFGAPPNVFISSWARFPGILVHVWPVGLAVALILIAVGVCLTRVARAPEPETARRSDALALFAVYGLVSCASLLGIVAAAYVQPCWRTLIILGLLGLTSAGDSAARRAGANTPAAVPVWMPVAALAAAVWMFVATPSAWPILKSAPHVVNEHLIHHTAFGVAGIWPETMHADEAVVASHTTPTGKLPSIWSTYSGWLEARYGLFHPSFDYIIHALGPANRAEYLARFRATTPQLVQTVLPTYGQYEPWIEQTSWDFYEDLLRRYTIVQRTPWSLFWERQAADASPNQLIGEPTVDPGTQIAALGPVPPSPGMPVTLMTVEVEYQARNPLGRIPLVGSNPRFLVGITGGLPHNPVTLDPYVAKARFPLVAAPGATPTFAFRTFSLLPGAALEVRHIRVWQVFVSPANQQWLAELVKQQSRQ
jgi:hypothetical protein